MTLENYKAERVKIRKEIEKLKKQSLSLLDKRRQYGIVSIVKDMQEYSITPEQRSAIMGGNSHSPNTPTILPAAIPSP